LQPLMSLELSLCRLLHSSAPLSSSSDQNSKGKEKSSNKGGGEESSSGNNQNNDDDEKERQRMQANMKMFMIGLVVFPVLYNIAARLMERAIKNKREREEFYQQKDEQIFFNTGTPASRMPAAAAGQQQRPPPPASLNRQEVNWSEFYYEMLLAGEVQEIIIHSGLNFATVILRPDAVIRGRPVVSNRYQLKYGSTTGPQARKASSLDSANLEDKIRQIEAKIGIPPGNGVSITYDRKPEAIGQGLGVAFTVAVLVAIGLLFRRMGRSFTSGITGRFSQMTKADFTLIDPKTRNMSGKKMVKFSDVAGLKEAKIEVKEFVDYLKNPDKYKTLGAKPPKGALLLGPPGCGKTMLAKAVATEAHVPFLSMNGSEFIEMVSGLGAARVRSLFAEARKRSPAIIYIDEIDAIGRKRGGGVGGSGSGGESEQTLNQLLVEMDGLLSSSQGNVIMLASTNRADVLDRALLRPGRFDRHITIDLPSVVERKEILEGHMKGVKLADKVDTYSERMATLTPGFSGADLANLVNEAALHAARLKKDKVHSKDLEYAIERVIAGPEKKTNVLSPAERRVVAYHESGHAIVGWMLQHTDALLKVTILPRTSQALGFAQYTPVDKKLYSPEEFMDRMCMALGGRVAESLTFNRITTGAQNDLEKVTKMANAQITQFGFNDKIGLVSFENDGGKKPYSNKLQNTMDMEARSLISEAYKRTEEVLRLHKADLETMAEALLDRETLNYDDVEALLGPPPFGKKHLVSPIDFENQMKQQAEMGGGGAAGSSSGNSGGGGGEQQKM